MSAFYQNTQDWFSKISRNAKAISLCGPAVRRYAVIEIMVGAAATITLL